jgi:hypothetical protein
MVPTTFEMLIGHNRKAAATERNDGIHGDAKTALNTGRVHGTGANGARSNSWSFSSVCATKSCESGLCFSEELFVSGDTPVITGFHEHEHYDLDPRTAPREG